MTPLMMASLLMLLAATGWCGRLLLRTGDGRLRVLTATLGLVALGQVLALVAQTESLAVTLAVRLVEVPPLGLSVMALLAVALLDQVVARHGRPEPDVGVEQAPLEALFESAPEAIILLDNDGRVLRVNSEFAAMFGYTAEEAMGQWSDQMLAPNELAEEARAITEKVAAGEKVSLESVRRHKDGTLVHVSILGVPVQQAGGQKAVLAIYRDITTQKRSDETLRRLEKAFETMQLGVTITDLEGHILFTNPADAAMHGYSAEELIGQEAGVFAPPGSRQRMRLDQIKQMTSWRRDTVNFRKDGSVFPVQLMSDVVRNAADEPVGIVTTCEDITQRKRMEEELAHQALYDSLTELPNRAFCLNLLEQSIRRMERHEDYMFAVLFLDLDRFKLVNDSLGHTIGDQLLVALAHRLAECMRPGDVVARLGGDEFAILLDTIKDSSDATRVAERIEGAMRPPFRLDGRDVFTTASIGIALSGPDYRTPEDLLRDADTAMYRAKARQSARYEIFNEVMHTRVTALLQLETDLRNGLDHGEFRLVFQPVVSLETGRIAGFEALVRWEHSERGLIAPDGFIRVAEETGLIVPLGRWVLEQACKQVREWQKKFPSDPPLTVSVNVSLREIKQPDFVENVLSTIRSVDLDPSGLKLEVTEGLLMESAETNVTVLRRLAEGGVRVLIDDFGTGYSSLSYLHKFSVDTLKIDRSFVDALTGANENVAIIRTIITLARALGMSVIAEGVETEEQHKRLRELDCEEVQGFLFSKAVDPQTAERLLTQPA